MTFSVPPTNNLLRQRKFRSQESCDWSVMTSYGQYVVGGESRQKLANILLLLMMFCFSGCVQGQCGGAPLYLMPGNSSGHLAFPEVNWDGHEGVWQPYQFYPMAVRCTWVIRAPSAHVLEAMFLHFDTEQDYDFVTIYGSEARREQLFRVSGDMTGDWLVTSPEDTLVVDFISDDYTTYYGFHLAYRYLPRACVEGGITVAEEHLIALPATNLQGVQPGPRLTKQPSTSVVPKGGARRQSKDEIKAAKDAPSMEKPAMKWLPLAQYVPWSNCTWRIAVDSRNIVQMDILRFDTSAKDILTIRQMAAGGEVTTLLQYGGDDPQPRSFQSTKPLMVTFIAASNIPGSGFLMDVSYIMRACDPEVQEIGAPRGIIGYPSPNVVEGVWRTSNQVHYGPDSCMWHLRAPQGYVLNVTILHFDTHPSDHLQVFEETSMAFFHSGGQPSRTTFISRSSNLTFKFSPEEDTGHTGFLLQYAWLLKDCGGNLSGESGEIRSPYYPDTYGPNVTCRWKLLPPSGHIVHLLMARLRLDHGDALQVSDGEKDLKITSNMAGRLMELRAGPPVTIFFSSDQQHNQGYFLLQYSTYPEGSCNFELSPCGWASTDPLQAWAFQGKQGRMVVTEETGLGLQLPRGYRSLLSSPWLSSSLGNTSLLAEERTICFRLDYLLDGPDAFLLTATLKEEKESGKQTSTGLNFMQKPLLYLYGAHGNTSLTTAVNFTVTRQFQVEIQYERGYGPHYSVGITGVSMTEGACDGGLDYLKAASCTFEKHYCGWRNTHTDHTNWLLAEHGIVAEVRSATVGDSKGRISGVPFSWQEQQWADLLSPVLTRDGLISGDDLVSSEDFSLRNDHNFSSSVLKGMSRSDILNDTEPVIDVIDNIYSIINNDSSDLGACLTLRYRLLSANSELRMLIRTVEDTEQEGHTGGRRRHSSDGGDHGEIILWAQGHVKSPDTMTAFVNMRQKFLPPKSQVVLRGVGVGEGGGVGAVQVRSVVLQAGLCRTGPSCDFDEGFCSWRISYTGNTVWYIQPHHDDGEEGSHAAVLGDGGPTDSTSLTSEIIDTDRNLSLVFRYRLVGTSRCLSVSQQIADEEDTPSEVWRQCRGKGHHWLRECVTLTPRQQSYHVVFTAGTWEATAEIWLDDVVLSARPCDVTHPHPDPAQNMTSEPQWHCEPDATLCGMTQPELGHRDWVYVAIHESETERNVSSSTSPPFPTPPASTSPQTTQSSQGSSVEQEWGHTCRDGAPLQQAWLCDGIPDCPDGSDEENCDCDENKTNSGGCGGSHRVSHHLGDGLCAQGAFTCISGRAGPRDPCLPRELVCNGVADCINGEDETACIGVARAITTHDDVGNVGTIQCSGGLRIPVAWRCDGRKDCPLDGLDEVGCSYCGMEEFICPTSGVCVPAGQVCDGAASLPSCTDEQYCYVCPPAHLVCDICVPSWQICDGVWDCESGEDERECTGVGGVEDCGNGHFRCSSGHCLPQASVCDRRFDCPGGHDEHGCPDDNHDVHRYISVQGWEEAGAADKQQSTKEAGAVSRLVTPILHHPPGSVGLLSFLYRLDAWFGPSNATLSMEIVGAEDPSQGVQDFALWKQSGHKGRHWLSTQVLVQPPAEITSYRLAFLVSADDHPHNSQQLHLSQLSFSVVQSQGLQQLGGELLACEFDASLCGWSQARAVGGYSWVYAKASTHARRTGPITGYPDGGASGFIFADSLYGSEGDTADLLSPPLMLPDGPNPNICLKMAVFMFGAHVSRMSVHLWQHLSGRQELPDDQPAPHQANLFEIVGGLGLSWVPVSVTVSVGDLADPTGPFALVVRAIRGNGPEADIALDHMAILSGPCHLQPQLDTNLTLNPALVHHPHRTALTAGVALTPTPAPKQAQDPDSSTVADAESICGSLRTCTQCVAPSESPCTWCDLTQTCVSAHTPAADVCPRPFTVHHNKSSELRRGPGWCPQLSARQMGEVMVAAGSSPVLSFAVHNIQPSQTDSGWVCVFHPLSLQEEKEEAIFDEEEEKEALEITLLEGEGGEDQRRKRAEKKRKKEIRESLRLPGQFQGRVYDVGGGGVGEGVGVGSIKCGDGVTEIRPPTPRPHARYDVTLITPAAATLDNPAKVTLVVYDCDQLGSSTCQGCVSANATFACGWCVATENCITHAHCAGKTWFGPGSTCETEQEKSLGEASSGELENLSEPGTHLGEVEREDESDDQLTVSGEDHDAEGLMDFLESPGSDSVQEEFDSEHDDDDDGDAERDDEVRTTKEGRRKNKKRKGQQRGRQLINNIQDDAEEITQETEEEGMVNDSTDVKTGKIGLSKRSGRRALKATLKVGGRGRSFLRLPRHPGIYVARDAWRLHTGRQYYVPVSKKTLVNLGFVRQVTYGSLAEEKSRTVLINGSWKKAAGYYVDLFEKAGQDPVTSVITTSRTVFEQLLGQLLPDD